MPLFKRLLTFALRLGVVLVVVVAIMVSVLSFVQPLANGLREQVAQILSQRLGYEVSIGALRLSSAGIEPRITLEQVRLTKPEDGEVALSLRAMELDLDLSGSLLTRSPQFEALTLVGARLVIERSRDGRLRIVGLGALRNGDPRALELFLGQGRLNLAESEALYVDQRLGGKVVRLADISLAVQNAGTDHSMALTARLVPPGPISTEVRDSERDRASSGGDGNRVELIAALDGPPSAPWSWTGRLYAKLEASDLGLLTQAAPVREAGLSTARIAVESWLRVEQGALAQSLARVELEQLETALPPLTDGRGTSGEGRLRIQRLRAMGRLRAKAPGWQLQLAGVDAVVDSVPAPIVNLDLRFTRDWGLAGLGATSDRVDLTEAARLLGSSPWPLPRPVQRVVERHPKGIVNDLALGLARPVAADPDMGWRWKLSAGLEGLGLDQKGSLPGFEGLSAVLSGDQDAGEMKLASDRMSLDLKPLFDLPIDLTRLGARLDWRRDPGGTMHLSVRDVQLANADLSGRAQLSLDLPGGGASPFMDLRASFEGASAARVRTYLPVGVMSPQLVIWLEEALVSGKVARGDAIFRGKLADYPFRKNQGRFELLLRFENLLLDYQKGWPPIESAGGSVRFLNEALTIEVDEGRIYQSAFSDGHARLPDVWHSSSLQIHGEAQGPFSDGLRTLKETPLSKQFGRLAGVLAVSGESHLALDIDLPFTHGEEIGVTGKLSWPGPATLGLSDTPVELSGLEGGVEFTNDRLKADRIDAKLWGRPVTVEIATEGAGDPDASMTRIRASAETPIQVLKEQFPVDAWRFLEGTLDWRLAVSLHNRDVSQQTLPLDFELKSPLQGVALELPAPLGKAAAARRDLAIGGTLTPGKSLALNGHLGDLGARLRFDVVSGGARLSAGRVTIGQETPLEPQKGSLVLDGQLAKLDLAPWISWLQADAGGEVGDAGQSLLSGAGTGPDVSLDLGADRLSLGGLALSHATLQADRRGQGWQVGVRSDELAGHVYLAAEGDARPLGINLERLDLKALAGQEPEAPKTAEATRLPSLDLRATQLKWGETLLGSLDLALRREPPGLLMPRIAIDGPGLVWLNGNGRWTEGRDGGRSQVELTVRATDLGRLLAELDEKRALEAKDATAKLKLSWPGRLTDPSLRRSRGSIDLRVGEGRFLEVEPGVGRLLGFLNINALGRRLALDFSDLYGQGFAFEHISGRLSLGQGRARFDDFVIDGTAGKVMVSGSTDLVAERFDQTVTVEPKVGSSVALASAVAGGPVVGAAVYLVDRVAGNPIDRLARYQYRVTGPWDDPVMTRMGWELPSKQDWMPAPTAKDDREEAAQGHFLDLH